MSDSLFGAPPAPAAITPQSLVQTAMQYGTTDLVTLIKVNMQCNFPLKLHALTTIMSNYVRILYLGQGLKSVAVTRPDCDYSHPGALATRSFTQACIQTDALAHVDMHAHLPAWAILMTGSLMYLSTCFVNPHHRKYALSMLLKNIPLLYPHPHTVSISSTFLTPTQPTTAHQSTHCECPALAADETAKKNLAALEVSLASDKIAAELVYLYSI